MTKQLKPKASAWRERKIEDWITGTFQQYLRDRHEEYYGIPYTARSYAIEGRWIKLMISEHGPEVLKDFIDTCFAEYKPTPQYPSLNFSFMHTYQKNRNLPKILADHARRKVEAVKAEGRRFEKDIDEDTLDWL